MLNNSFIILKRNIQLCTNMPKPKQKDRIKIFQKEFPVIFRLAIIDESILKSIYTIQFHCTIFNLTCAIVCTRHNPSELQKVLNLPTGRISGLFNLPQNCGNFGFRDIHK